MKYLTTLDDETSIRFCPVPDDFDLTGFDLADDFMMIYRDSHFGLVDQPYIVDDASYIDFEKSCSYFALMHPETITRDDDLINEFERFRG